MARPIPAGQPTLAPLLSMSEIASLACVERPVVSTWRRRYSDFPEPVSHRADGRVLFDGGQVIEWLISTGLGKADPVHLRIELVLHGLTASVDRTDPGRTVETLSALLCLRYLDGKPLCDPTREVSASAALAQRAERLDPEDEFFLRELRSAGPALEQLAGIAEDMVEAAYSERGASEWLLAARHRLGLPQLAADTLAPHLRKLLIGLADLPALVDGRQSLTIADPNTHGGDLLMELINAGGDEPNMIALGADPDEQLARLTRRRLLLAGIDEMSLDVQVGADLEEGIADPNLIVTQLPYHPSENRWAEGTLREISRVTDLLGPGTVAIVLGPAEAMVDPLSDTAAAKLRSELLRNNLIESVIALPGGGLPYRPGYRTAIWTLSRTPVSGAKGKVLLADISSEPMTDAVCARLIEDVVLWRAEGHRPLGGHDPRYGCAQNVAYLDKQFGGTLLPTQPPISQRLARTVTERSAMIVEAETRLEEAADRARTYQKEYGRYQGRVVTRVDDSPRRTTVGALIADGHLSKIKGHRVEARDVNPDDGYALLGPEEILGHSGLGSRRVDRMLLGSRYNYVALTKPGDVIYTLAPEFGVHVDHDGSKIAAFPARILRVRSSATKTLTPRVLAALLSAARGTTRSPSAVRPARRIEDYELPDLTLADVEAFDAVLTELDRREQLLGAQSEALTETRQLTIAGLADGTLTFGQNQ